MTEADPAAPPPRAPAAPPGPSLAPAGGSSASAWLGIIAVSFGALVMVVGVVSVYLYTKRLPAPPPPALPSPAASAVTPAPALEPPAPVPPSPSEKSRAVPSAMPPAALAPFVEDAAALVPVERGRPLWGPRNAPVTLTVFGDLECPYTIAMLRVILAEKTRRGDDLRLSFRFATRSQHEEGAHAARTLSAIHAAQGEGAFWSVVQEIVRRGEPLTEGALDIVLETLGIVSSELDASVEKKLEDDAVLATSLYVRATPVCFVNGVRLEGYRTQRALAEVIARERKSSGLVLASGVTPQALYGERTRKNLINVGKDPPERACVPTTGSPARGAKDALVTIVEFTEHACDYCREGDALVAGVLASRPKEVRSVWKTLPLPQHARARYAASFALEARRTAGDAAFWAVTRVLFGAKDGLVDGAVFEAAAEASKLDLAKLLLAAEQSAHDTSVDIDQKLAESLGVSAVPTYFVNGKRIPGVVSPVEFRAVVSEELDLARRVKRNGAGDVAELACGARVPK
jgi:protein-disulfide isomerase